MVLRKFSEITYYKPIFSQYSIFYKCISFFNLRFDLFSQSKQEECSLCCSSTCFHVLLCTHYGSLQCFSTYFRKLKEIGVLRPIFQSVAKVFGDAPSLTSFIFLSKYITLWCTKALFNTKSKNNTKLKKIILVKNIILS